MIKFYFKKLVRDKVINYCLIDPKVIETNYRKLDRKQYRRELAEKVREELSELVEAKDGYEQLSELADLQSVVDALIDSLGSSKEQIENEKKRKIDRKGGFAGRQYIDSVVLSDDSPWVETFRKQPDKYLEETVIDIK